MTAHLYDTLWPTQHEPLSFWAGGHGNLKGRGRLCVAIRTRCVVIYASFKHASCVVEE